MSLIDQSPVTAFTLTQLTAHVGNALRLRPELQQAWVTAELSDVRSSGGHCYMELVEKNPAGQTMAKMRANIWASTFRVLQRKFSDATGRTITSGLKVMLRGSVTHHPVYGMSFNVTDIDPSYTLGDIERLRREILQRLAAEGVADVNRSLVMPAAPQRIAVISAAGAAGYGDFCNQLQGNPEGFVFYPHLFGAVMQGERTAPSILAALDAIEETAGIWDAVVIIRGGGATTDLIGFDNLELARRVATFPLPVIVGIGHERDNTVLDYIANTRCKTPTAVAEHLINTLREAARRVAECVNYIIRYSTERVRGESQRLTSAGGMISAIASTRIARQQSRIEAIRGALPVAASNRLNLARRSLETTLMTVGSLSRGHLQMESQRLQTLGPRIAEAAHFTSRRQHDRLLRLKSMLDVLSPEATLRRGYSITMVNGHAVTSINNMPEGAVITTRLADGILISNITEKHPSE